MQPLKYLKVDIETKKSYKPPYFANSMIRGVLGRALKRVTCINPSMECEGCFAMDNCLYYKWYEDKNSYHTYRITSKLGMNYLKFSVWLYEDAIKDLPYLLSSLKMAFEDIGVGNPKNRKKLEIDSIKIANRVVYKDSKFDSLKDIEPIEFIPQNLYEDVIIRFNTPLRIKQNNRFIRKGNELKLNSLINSIHKRYYQLKALDAPKLNYISKGEIDTKMHFLELSRYSNRQKTSMNMGGIIGEMSIKGLDKQSSYYIQLGEILGVGKQTVFGLGDYSLYPLNN